MKKLLLCLLLVSVSFAATKTSSAIRLSNGYLGDPIQQNQYYGGEFPQLFNKVVADIDTLFAFTGGVSSDSLKKAAINATRLYFGQATGTRSYVDSMFSKYDTVGTIVADSIAIKNGVSFPVRYDDMDPFNLGAAKASGQTGFPSWFQTANGFGQYIFGVNDSAIGNIEHGHKFIEGDTLHFHLHYTPARLDANPKHVKFSIHYLIRNPGDTTTLYTNTISKEDTIAANTSTNYQKILEIGEVATPAVKIGAMITIMIKRIAASGGTSDTLSPLVHQVGIHKKVNSLGSRTETTK